MIEALANVGLKCWADKACQGAGEAVRVPFRGRRLKRCTNRITGMVKAVLVLHHA